MVNYILKELDPTSLKEIFGYEGPIDIPRLLDKELLKSLGLDSAIIYCYDEIITDKVGNLDLDVDNIMEARIFNENKELRIWRDEEVLRGSVFKEANEVTTPIEEEYILYPRKEKGFNPSKLVVKKYIDYDQDGQAYVSYVKPSKLI